MTELITSKKKYIFIDYLKAIAALIIINSHFDSLYPISQLATGGAIGNAIFFAVSGFCLYPIRTNFFCWIYPKIVRIYFPAIIMTIISLLTINRDLLKTKSLFFIFVWPTIFWFIGAIVLFYILFYFFGFVKTDKEFNIFFAFTTIIYFVYYSFLDTTTWVIESAGLDSINGCFKLVYYFAIMMIGKWFRIHIDRRYAHKKIYLFNIVLSFVSIYGVKLLMAKNHGLLYLQFLNQLCTVWFIITLFMLCISFEEKLVKGSEKVLYKISAYIGKMTLHMYVVQFIVIYYVGTFPFPINALIAVCFILFFGAILEKITRLNTKRGKIKCI